MDGPGYLQHKIDDLQQTHHAFAERMLGEISKLEVRIIESLATRVRKEELEELKSEMNKLQVRVATIAAVVGASVGGSLQWLI